MDNEGQRTVSDHGIMVDVDDGLNSIWGIQCLDCNTTSYKFTPVAVEEGYIGVKGATRLNQCVRGVVCVCHYCGVGWHTDNLSRKRGTKQRMKYHFESSKKHKLAVLEAGGTNGEKHQQFVAEFEVKNCDMNIEGEAEPGPVGGEEGERESKSLEEADEDDCALFPSPSTKAEEAMIRNFTNNLVTLNYGLALLKGQGLSELVSNSIHHNKWCAVSPIDLLLFSSTARMTLTTTKKQKEDVAAILKVCSEREGRLANQNQILQKKIHELEQSRCGTDSRMPFVPTAIMGMMPLPDTPAKIRRLFLEGKYSLRKNLPMANIERMNDHHGYCSVKEALAVSMLHKSFVIAKIPTRHPSVVSAMWNSPVVVGLGVRASRRTNVDGLPILPIYLVIWVDDAERRKSIQNQKSLWHLTCTASPRSADVMNTLYISVGTKGSDHDEVISQFIDEVASMKDSA